MIGITINAFVLIIFALLGHFSFRTIIKSAPETQLKDLIRRPSLMLPFLTIVVLGAVGLSCLHFIYGDHIPLRYLVMVSGFRECIMILLAFTGYSGVILINSAFRSRSRMRYVVLALLSLLTAGLLFANHLSPASREFELSQDAEMGRLVYQTTGASCSAAAAANALQRFGLVKSEKEMGELFGTDEDGTSKEQIIDGLSRLGFTGKRVYRSSRDPRQIHAPALLFVKLRPGGPTMHTITLMAASERTVEIWDPMGFCGEVEFDELRDTWPGAAIEIYDAR